MRFSFAVLALSSVFAAVSAQSIPNCALQCIASANLGGCGATDNVCLCKNQAFIQSSTACIESSCTGSDLTNAESAAQALCAAVGVTLTAPASTATNTAPASSSKASSSATASPSPSHGAAMSNGVNALVGAAALFGAFAL